MNLQKMSLKELRELAKEKGISGVSGLRKADLLREIEKHMSAGTQAEEMKRSTKPETKPKAEHNAEHKAELNAEPKAELKAEQKAKRPVRAANGTDADGANGGNPQGVKPRQKNDGSRQTYTYVPNHDDRYHARQQGGSGYNRYENRQNTAPETQPYRQSEPQPYRQQGGTGQGRYENRQTTASETQPYRQQGGTGQGRYENRQETRPNTVAEPPVYRSLDEVEKAGLITIAKDRHVTDVHPTEVKELDSGITKKGILEVMSEGYGFIRCDNFLPGENDVYVSPAFLRRFGLRTGDIIEGNLRVKTQNEKFSALLYMKRVNERKVTYLAHRNKFEDLTPIFPNERIHLETPNAGVSMRMLDLISPIGKGQRGMIVSQPKTGKTTLLKQVASAITKNYPKMHLLILLIDERPEEVTDIKESIEGERVDVIYSTFDELPENHRRVSEMVIERAKRLVEGGDDVVVLLDSITRLARAYNLTVTPSGRTLSGGLDPAALHMPKRFFGAARNMREGGSLTILATALVDTGSRMDDVVFEEFKGTGNMELVLDRHLSEKRVFPAIDIQKSSTRREDLLLSRDELEAVYVMRKALGGNSNTDGNLEQIINLFRRTKNNKEFVETIKKIKLH